MIIWSKKKKTNNYDDNDEGNNQNLSEINSQEEPKNIPEQRSAID